MEAEKMCPKLKMKHGIEGDRFYTMIRDTSLSYNHDIPRKCYMVNLHHHFDIISINTQIEQETQRSDRDNKVPCIPTSNDQRQ
ncbi:hypothetical protein NC653_010603 [Populus alba x Populus x berolinensis]|uniref:Uncharacterized protein n=1 Tax=Populus alba x Populus x berolinensis TaxID=444605 RepID=A0AAD6R052_9ROSI|nr:hypothetical protein NC653_010603 [Populus alba x Populus x berolinensis]